jgi:hypothetical protein
MEVAELINDIPVWLKAIIFCMTFAEVMEMAGIYCDSVI